MSLEPTSLEDVQAGWRRRWADPEVERPYCYNREDFIGPWEPGCSMWFKPGGNAYRLESFIGQGKTLRWSACTGCKQKP